MRSMALRLSTSGYLTLEKNHLLLPATSVLVIRYIDSSFLTDLNVTSSEISRSPVISLMAVFCPMRS